MALTCTLGILFSEDTHTSLC